MKRTTIEVIDVHKSFKSYKDRAFQLKDAVVFRNFNKGEKREILKGISFSVKEGQALALIGKNGCGKSTTLKLLTRILRPDSGKINIVGRVSSLIELGAGFHPDMSGRENIYINASIFGLSKKEVDSRLDDIIRFSEIEEFIDDPVRTYSSGMYMRLAFAIAINVDADVLLIDEILAVGDAAFQAKCFNKLKALKASGVTIVLVSHSMEQIKKLCDRVIWIEDGRIREEGDVKEVCDNYAKAMEAARIERDRLEREQRGETESLTADVDGISAQEELEQEADENDKKGSCRLLTSQCGDSAEREGTWRARYTKIALCNSFGEPCTKFLNGDKIIIKMEYVNTEVEHNYSFYVGITRDDNVRVNESSTKRECGELMPVPARGMVSYVIDANSLLQGRYTLGARIYGENSELCDDIVNLIPFEVLNKNEHEAGMVSMKHRWMVNGEKLMASGETNTEDNEVQSVEKVEVMEKKKKSGHLSKIAVGLIEVAVVVLLIGVCYYGYGFIKNRIKDKVQETTYTRDIIMGTHKRENTLISAPESTAGYFDILPEDYISIMDINSLPALERMDKAEAAGLVDDMQVIRKINNLGINTETFYTPELNYKRLYNEIEKVLEERNFSDSYEFTGNKISELNEFLQGKQNATIEFAEKSVLFDETLMVQSGQCIDAGGVHFTIENPLDKVIHVVDGTDVKIKNFEIKDGEYTYGCFISNSTKVSVENCSFYNAQYKGIVALGNNEYLKVEECVIDNAQGGGMYFNGDMSKMIIHRNTVSNTKGTNNYSAGIVFGCVRLLDFDQVYKPFEEIALGERLSNPHDVVVYDNIVYKSNSSGIYSDGAYKLYLVNNTSYLNDKEGMCLDGGSFGCYVANNTLKQNGGRRRQTMEDLVNDYVGDFGTLDDGSSPAKLPGLSMDNAAYNIITDNNICNNYGSGVKIVRSGARNIIINNAITDNNVGESASWHFFGIELAYAAKPDYEIANIDFKSCYENIIARNIIRGEHYAGIFLAEECYINDFFDNVIMGPTWWSMECLSDKFNSTANNISDISSRGIDLSNATGGVYVFPGVAD